MPEDSPALVLEILKQDNQLSMSIFEKEEIISTVRHYSQVSFSFTEMHKLSGEVISTLNKVNKNGFLTEEGINNLKKTGLLLWDHLLAGQVKEKLRTTHIADLILSLDETLIDIPWELLYDGKDFLCLKFNLGRLVRTKEKMGPPQYRNFPSKLKMLILANPTNDLKSAYLEGIYIKDQLDRRRDKISIDFKTTQIDTLYVKKNLRDYDVVHFAGHCERDSKDPENSGWVLNDGRFTIQDIFALGESLSLPILVFSNACHSAEAKADLLELDYQTKTYSLASAFLFSGTRHYIGTIRKIEDQMSLVFSKEFYTHLINGKSVGECLRLARLKIIREHGLAALPWMSYLLYGDPHFVLFKTKKVQPFKRDYSKLKKYLTRFVFVLLIIFICLYLYMWLPTVNPNTYLLFTKSQKLFREGNNQKVILFSSRIIQKDPLFLAIYPLIAKTYQRLGKPEEALRYYFDCARFSEKKHDKKNLVAAYIEIGWIYQLQGEYPKAFDFYNQAVTLSKNNQDKLNQAVALRKLAVWYIDKEIYDKALELLTQSSEINRDRQKYRQHKYNLACDYFDIALVFANKDDFNTAKEFYRKSLALLEKLKLKDKLSDYYFNLGEICLFEKQYAKALDYYMRGLKIDQIQDNKPSIASDYNMIGELYIEMGNLTEAEKSFNQSLSICQEINAPLELAATCYNLGLLYKETEKINQAKEYLTQAKEIYGRIGTPQYSEIEKELLEITNK